MRICLDARNLGPEMAGVGRYILGLVPALARTAPHHQYLVLRHASCAHQIGNGLPNVKEVVVEAADDGLGQVLLGHRTLARVFAAHGVPDVYHALFHVLPVFRLAGSNGAPRVVTTVHDLMWLERPFECAPGVRGLGTWVLGRCLARGLHRADALIAVSEETRKAIIAQTGLDRVRVVHHGVDERFFAAPPPMPARWPLAGSVPYVIGVGNGKPYKNLALLIRAFAEATRGRQPGKLVLVGDCRGLEPIALEAGVKDTTLFTGLVSEDEVVPLLGHARLFVMPSLREGFGLPIIEAMALGVPVAIADVAPLTEVADSAAMRFDPHDVTGLAAIIARLLEDQACAADWSASSRARASAFHWSKAAAATLEVYEDARRA